MPSSYRKKAVLHALTVAIVVRVDEDLLTMQATSSGTGELTFDDSFTIDHRTTSSDVIAGHVSAVVQAWLEVSHHQALVLFGRGRDL